MHSELIRIMELPDNRFRFADHELDGLPKTVHPRHWVLAF